jgi:hypothetical protein
MLVPASDVARPWRSQGDTRAMPPPLSIADAIVVAKRARKLLRAGRITHRQFTLIDCLLWSCRNPITGTICVSYSALQRLCHVARDTIAEALRVLERLGVLTRIKRRVRVVWGASIASRQATSSYVLHPRTESSGRPVDQSESIQVLSERCDLFADLAALAQRRRVIEGRLLTNKA